MPKPLARRLLALVPLLLACGEEPAAPVERREWLDVPYASTSPAQRLDLWLPPTGDGPFPMVLWVHGGGWREGTRALPPDAFQRQVLERGIALAAVGYRLSPEAIWPAQIHDLKAAVRWLRANAAAHHLDQGRIGVWGASAGGHLAAVLGSSGGVPALEGAALGNSGVSSRVQAVVDWFGPTDFLSMDEQTAALGCRNPIPFTTADSPASQLLGSPVRDRPDLVHAASPMSYASADDPPFLIQHGAEDCTVAPRQSMLLRDALLLLPALPGAARVEMDLVPGADHGYPAAMTSPATLGRVLDFLERWLAR